MMKTTFKLKAISSGLLIGLAGSTPAGAVSIADTPLFIGTAVDPNVMLLVDTSGSMDNIIWASGYDNTLTYPDWSNGGANYDPKNSNNRTGNHGKGAACSDGWKEGKNATGKTKCLRLPDPAGGGDTRYTGNYLNYLFETYADNTDLAGGAIPNETRIQVARTASKDLVDKSSGVRFGTSSFYNPSDKNYGHGATIDEACDSNNAAAVKAAIDNYTASSSTPVAEALYEVTRYFRGLSSFYHDDTSYTSPIEYRCQHNFSVVITDGLPTRDTTFATNDPDDPSGRLPDWDGLAPATTAAMHPHFPQYSDGFHPDGSEGEEGYSLYLDDIAKFGHDTDFKTSGNDNAGGSYQDPLFPLQSMETYTIGFAQSNQMLEDAAAYGNGDYVTANNATDLANALRNAIDNAKYKGQAAAAAVATNSTRLDTNTTIYQARFDSRDWSGDLLALSIDPDTGDVGLTPDWSAQNLLPPSASATVSAASRNIYTYDPTNSAGIPFRWPSDYTALAAGSDLNSAMVQALLSNAPYAWNTGVGAEQAANQAYGAELLAYLRGDTSNNGSYNSAFRSRKTVLGDIVNSNPAFVGGRDFGFRSLPGTEGTDYLAFRNTSAYKNTIPVVYVGANDGMLHAFNADTGTELFAYVPSTVFPKLDALADSTYTHQYYVNGSPRVSDAYLGASWKTLLVGAPGGGGRSVFALDITSPTAFSESKVLWEFTSGDDPDLGYVLGQPTIARMNDGSWVALVGNGYNGVNDRAMLFIINLADGTLLKKIDTTVGSSLSPNGLSAPVPVDIDGDKITDSIYAGDLQGNLWKFDVSATNSGSWDIAYKTSGGGQPQPAPLFKALDAGGTAQAITVRPAVGLHPKGGIMVYFGTGKFFEVGDNIVPLNPPVNSFYGIRDEGVKVSGRGVLQAQTIDEELYDVSFGSNVFDARVVSDNSIDYTTQKGWYLDLKSPVKGAEGERVVVDPLLRNGRMVFSTLIPALDVCGFGGSGWLMEVDAVNGARFAFSVFDLDGDGLFDDGDYVTLGDGSKVPVSGQRFREIISQPVVIDAGEREFKYVSGSSGSIQTVDERGDSSKGRQSWRQIR
jgi:type IV pilus assembly protein PilY1